ncbi:response regulator transcription factor [Fictibacillus sp. 5RED26]|uniref:response regulator transcription factor n=1 Tax=Fictibacillus sp. 5RED26 TaxID=2745876 RepID=UPI0018CF442F|nr:response regulator transcription factor [Fictibacillus sp. 5RED26]
MTHILIVDDDKNILELLHYHLSEAGYQVSQAKDGMESLDILRLKRFDLAVVDVMMPFMNGYSLTKEIRENYDIPVILLTSKNQIEDKEQGYLSGTDDYLVKPFEARELLFRIKALLRRYDKHQDNSIISLGRTTVNKKTYEVYINDVTILLPLKEFELLYFFISNPMQAFTRDQLIQHIWGLNYEGDDRTVDVHVKRLRERFSNLTDDFKIKTVRGVGYLLEVKK